MAKDWARPFYKSDAWERTALYVRRKRRYTCERCGEPGRIVHHREHLTPENIGDPEIALSIDNLELLCQECHNKEHSKEHSKAVKATANGLIFTADGELIREKHPPGSK